MRKIISVLVLLTCVVGIVLAEPRDWKEVIIINDKSYVIGEVVMQGFDDAFLGKDYNIEFEAGHYKPTNKKTYGDRVLICSEYNVGYRTGLLAKIEVLEGKTALSMEDYIKKYDKINNK